MQLRCAPIALLSVAMGVVGCASSPYSVYIHPAADFSTIERIAVLPLENMTTDRYASDRVREILIVEILATGAFDVVDPGEVNRVLRASNIQSVDGLGPEALAALGLDLQVQALLMGSVLDYRERRTGNLTVPEVALSLRLLDVETGTVVWSVTDARRGLSWWAKLFGMGEESITDAVRELVKTLLPSLFGET